MTKKTEKSADPIPAPKKTRVKKVEVFDQDSGADIVSGPVPKRIHKEGQRGQSRSGPVHS